MQDADSSIKPRFASSRTAGAASNGGQGGSSNGTGDADDDEAGGDDNDHGEDDEDEDEDEDDDGEEEEWTLRKCAALAIDELAAAFQDHLLPLLLPLLRQMLDASDWLVRESGILTIGAIAEGMVVRLAAAAAPAQSSPSTLLPRPPGCKKGMQPYLVELVPFLFANMRYPRVRLGPHCFLKKRVPPLTAAPPQYAGGAGPGALHQLLDAEPLRALDRGRAQGAGERGAGGHAAAVC